MLYQYGYHQQHILSFMECLNIKSEAGIIIYALLKSISFSNMDLTLDFSMLFFSIFQKNKINMLKAYN